MNIDIDLLRSEYNNRLSNFQFLIETVKFILQKEIDKNKIKYHSFTHRIKSFDSFVDKIHRKNNSEPFKDIHDLVGFRVVCLFLSDLELIGNIINREFYVFEENDKVDNSELDIFGYMSLHYKAKLKVNSSSQGLTIVQEIPFEIQVRTIAQDAWASISHYLDYKQESFLPDQLRRDLHALSGLFYVADTHFSMLRKAQLRFFVGKTLKTGSAQQTNQGDKK
jgi:ppGpp synthetase/RelA/SpoT-type nucleotidyltranferase